MIGIRDVTWRDGLQDEQPIDTDDKLALFDALVAAGVTDLEITSFVRPDRVPPMADAEDVARRTAGRDGLTRWGLVLNARGAERALNAGVHHLQFVVSVSESHNRENAGRDVAGSIAELERILALAHAASNDTAEHVSVEVTLATAFGCPFAGPVSPSDVVGVADQALAAGVDGLTLADTIGTALPTEVRSQIRAIRAVAPDVPLGVHLHDTRGLAIANALSAIEEGADRIDGTVGGLGGCPFAPGASGNLALEDLVHALSGMGIETGLDLDRLVAAAELACGFFGRPVGSHVGVAGPRFARTPHAEQTTAS